jgi:hypothetical protein
MIVNCPNCKREYEISEIFIPTEVFGKIPPNGILKGKDGKIKMVLYKDEPIFIEEYICDNCNNKFYTKLTLNTITFTEKERNDFLFREKEESLFDC